jgi:ABC-type transport system involved in cytochrome c biogenesis ATPase subunit
VRALVSAVGLTVARGRKVLLERFSLELAAGEAVHVAGANGCGKSSLLRVLAGVVEPRRGSVRRAASCVYVPERLALPESLPARRWLSICGSGEAELPGELKQRCGALSKGQLQRVVLTGALSGTSGRPAVLILDEPWAGLDVSARAALDAELADVVASGSAILYTDHGRATALAATRTLYLTGAEDELAASPSRVAIELVRGDDRAEVVITDSALAERLSDGWEIDRAQPLR